MCSPKMPSYTPQKQKVIAQPTYADAQTQSAVLNARKNAQSTNKQNIRSSARGVTAVADVQKSGLFSADDTNKKRTLGA